MNDRQSGSEHEPQPSETLRKRVERYVGATAAIVTLSVPARAISQEALHMPPGQVGVVMVSAGMLGAFLYDYINDRI